MTEQATHPTTKNELVLDSENLDELLECFDTDPDIIDLELDQPTVDFLNDVIDSIADYVCSAGIQSPDISVDPEKFCNHISVEIRNCKLD